MGEEAAGLVGRDRGQRLADRRLERHVEAVDLQPDPQLLPEQAGVEVGGDGAGGGGGDRLDADVPAVAPVLAEDLGLERGDALGVGRFGGHARRLLKAVLPARVMLGEQRPRRPGLAEAVAPAAVHDREATVAVDHQPGGEVAEAGQLLARLDHGLVVGGGSPPSFDATDLAIETETPVGNIDGRSERTPMAVSADQAPPRLAELPFNAPSRKRQARSR